MRVHRRRLETATWAAISGCEAVFSLLEDFIAIGWGFSSARAREVCHRDDGRVAGVVIAGW